MQFTIRLVMPTWPFILAWGVSHYASTNQIPQETIGKFFTNDGVRKKIDQSSCIILLQNARKIGQDSHLVNLRRSFSWSKDIPVDQSPVLSFNRPAHNVFQTSAISRNQEKLQPRDCRKASRFVQNRSFFVEARSHKTLGTFDSRREFLRECFRSSHG